MVSDIDEERLDKLRSKIESAVDPADLIEVMDGLRDCTEAELAIMSGLCADMRSLAHRMMLAESLPWRVQPWLEQRNAWRDYGERISAEFQRRIDVVSGRGHK